MLKEFREFAVKGNVMDLAVGVIIGGAFGGIVNSLVNDVVMPPIGLLLGGLDFKDYFIQLHGAAVTSLDAAKKAGVPVIAYGQFLTVLLNFIILAFVIFLMVKWINSLKKEEAVAPAAPAPPTRSEVLLEEIRDTLRRR
ncbi:MAG: large conductance mechanosensitive channel protein MscL [Bryobacterales bacterium]|nr:large conductance mechanosensitive channel protein MscL [Bryobacterales bacterium]